VGRNGRLIRRNALALIVALHRIRQIAGYELVDFYEDCLEGYTYLKFS